MQTYLYPGRENTRTLNQKSNNQCLIISLAIAFNALNNIHQTNDANDNDNEEKFAELWNLKQHTQRRLPYLTTLAIAKQGYSVEIISNVDNALLTTDPQKAMEPIFGVYTGRMFDELHPSEHNHALFQDCQDCENLTLIKKTPDVGDITSAIRRGGVSVISTQFSESSENIICHHYISIINVTVDFMEFSTRYEHYVNTTRSCEQIQEKINSGNINPESGAGGFLINIYPENSIF